MLENASDKESCVFDIEKKIHASLKKILLSEITFKEAQLQDPGDMLHQKYKPLNATYKPGQNKQNKAETNSKLDLPKPQVVLYPEENIQNSWQQIRRIGPGLANLGNTCFLNSVVQVLTYTPPLINYILSGYHKNNCKAVGFCMQCELTNHVNRVLNHSPNMGAVRPMSIIQKLQCIGKNFRFGRQEDAHEFLRFVVEALQKSDYAGKPKLDKVSKETTIANAIFGGYYRSQVQCRRCHLESNTYDPIMDLNLDIKDCSSIMHAFQKTIRPDHLNGDNKYFCERCKMKTDAIKRGTIHKEPNVLTLQLKRFDFSKMFGGKISKEIHFPEDLNIRPFMSVKGGEPVHYQLYGVLVHSGYSCNSGHYYCYVKASNGTWYEMNDNRVSQVSLKTVLGAQAYLLFYVKRAVKKSQHSNKHPTASVSTSSLSKDPLKHKNVINNNNSSNDNHLNRIGKKPAVVYGPQKPPHLKDVPILLNKSMSSNATATLATTTTTSTTTLTIDSIGVPVKRKSEPKININIGIKSRNSILSFIDKNDKKNNTTTPSKENAPFTSAASTPHKSQKHPSLLASSTPYKPLEKNDETTSTAKTNSLQKLSESYADTESPNSSVPSSPRERQPSPLPQSLPSPLVNSKKENKSTESHSDSKKPTTERAENTTNESGLYLSLSSISDAHSNKESNKSTNGKLKMTSMKYRNRNSIWSPVTKGALHPRVIINKTISSDSDPSKPRGESLSPPKSDVTQSSATASPWKEEKQIAQERMFGPMMPPPPSFKRQRNDSMTSEAGSSSSVHSQSGNWNIHEKPSNRQTSYDKQRSKADIQQERQHVGWNVSEQDSSHQSKKKFKKEKKHKKKKKHRRSSMENEPGAHDNSSEDYVQVSVDRHNRKRKQIEESFDQDVSVDHTLESPKKKKKRDKHDSERERERFNTLSDVLNDSKREKKKKKKNKHKHKYRNGIEDRHPENNGVTGRLDETLTFHHNISHPHSHTRKEDPIAVRESKSVRDTSQSDNLLRTSNKSMNLHATIDVPHIEKKSSHGLKKTFDSTSMKTDEQNISSKRSKKKKKKHKRERSNFSSDNESPHEGHPSAPRGIKTNDVVTFKKHETSKLDRSEFNENDLDKTLVYEEKKTPVKKKEVPVYAWDDQKKKINTWDGALKSTTVDQLLLGETKVSSWDGEDRTDLYSLKKHYEGERPQDEWDEEYDAGKIKKVKNKPKESDDQLRFQASFNSFQTLQNHRNDTKDNKATFRSQNHHGYHNNKQRHHHRKDRVSSGGGDGGRYR